MNETTAPVTSPPARPRVFQRHRYFACERCGKRIIERLENGLWYFSFGQPRNKQGVLVGVPAVEIYVYGSLKLRCMRKECNHWNVLNFFPFNFLTDVPESDEENPKDE